MVEVQDQSIILLFRQLGLDGKDARTYEALLALESVSIRKIAAQSGINRGTTLECLQRLKKHGLVSSRSSGDRSYYTAESPEKIYDLVREKQHEMLDAQMTARSVVPQLLAEQSRVQERPIVRYFENDEGIAAILRDVLQTTSGLSKKEYLVYSTRAIRQHLYRSMPRFTERRVTEGIVVRVIAIGEGGDTLRLAERKWLPQPQSAQILSSYTIIYGNKVATISVSSSLLPYGVVVEDAGNSATQRLLFEELWQRID